jgi:hypothetical protein
MSLQIDKKKLLLVVSAIEIIAPYPSQEVIYRNESMPNLCAGYYKNYTNRSTFPSRSDTGKLL